MFTIIINKINQKKSSLISGQNLENTSLDAVTKKENLNYITKFGLPASVAKHINSCFIVHNIHINDLIIVSDIKLYL